MTFWVYILRCADGSYYTGHTDNLEKRMGEHQTGTCGGYTAERLPVKLAWSQECAAREEALAAELQIKGWSRKKKEAMMQGDWGEVNRLGRGKHRHQRTAVGAPVSGATASTLHASTSAALPPTLSTNGEDVVHRKRSEDDAVRPESFEPNSVRPERSAAKSKDKIS